MPTFPSGTPGYGGAFGVGTAGPAGPTGAAGNPTTTTTSIFYPPQAGSSASVNVATASFFTQNQYIQITDGSSGALAYEGIVSSISGSTLTLTTIQQGSVSALAIGSVCALGSGPAKRGCVLKLNSADFTPIATGLDPGTIVWIPYDPLVPSDGRALTWVVQAIKIRVETPGSSATTIQIARSTGTGIFTNAGYLNTTALSLAASTYEAAQYNSALAQGTVNSGDKLQVNWTALGSGMLNPTIIIELKEQ